MRIYDLRFTSRAPRAEGFTGKSASGRMWSFYTKAAKRRNVQFKRATNPNSAERGCVIPTSRSAPAR